MDSMEEEREGNWRANNLVRAQQGRGLDRARQLSRTDWAAPAGTAETVVHPGFPLSPRDVCPLAVAVAGCTAMTSGYQTRINNRPVR